MSAGLFRMPLHLPAQGAAEIEATIIEWSVGEGDRFAKGQMLAQVDSAKSVFDFEAPCDGMVIRLFHLEGETVLLSDPVMEIETSDPEMKNWIPPAAASEALPLEPLASIARPAPQPNTGVVISGIGTYLPKRIVSNAELVECYPDITEQYVYQVTGIRQRHWAAHDEKPSSMAFKASLEAIRASAIGTKDIDAIILATTTPDVAMPSTACILQDRLSLGPIPAFDINAACSGWLYAVAMARGMICSGLAKHVLTVGVDMQSRLLDRDDRSAYFIFGDGAGAAIISAGTEGHRIREVIVRADPRGLHHARRENPGYFITNGQPDIDPWIRLDGPALFRLATDNFTTIIRDAVARSGWTAEQTRWVIPHQANGRILKAAAKRSGLSFDRFFLNVDHVGNTSSASIPLALVEAEKQIEADDKVILCSVGAGLTAAAVSVEW
ncbi:MAG: beta-ketoacyl-ACP synthase 3 [Candidatus Nealsonbacteria bacterium]|nr:beta-ketoacyl-ACP synthase 3 [Candidatus Nealsonbacteria bacterium]